jgi:hypothetical protein
MITSKSRSARSFDDDSAVNCKEDIGVCLSGGPDGEALPATPTSIARP